MILAQRDPALAQAFEALYQRAPREQLWGAERPSPSERLSPYQRSLVT